MSLGLAILQISLYTDRMEKTQSEVRRIQGELETVVRGAGDPARQQKLQEELTMNNVLFDMYKGFVKFWQDTIQAFKEIMKSINELAFSR